MSRSSTKSKMAGFMTPNHIKLISRKIWLGEKFVVLHTACVYNLLMIKIDGATHRSLSLKIPVVEDKSTKNDILLSRCGISWW